MVEHEAPKRLADCLYHPRDAPCPWLYWPHARIASTLLEARSYFHWCATPPPINGGIHPAGTELHRIQLSGEVVCVCPGCRHHYSSKQSTVITRSRQPSTSSSLPAGHISPSDAQVHKNIKAAQQHHKIPVKGIGSLSAPSNNHGQQIATTNGYTQNHRSYDDDLAYNRKRALASSSAVHSSITGSVSFRLVYLAGSKYFTFGSCQKAKRAVPVTIGAQALLQVAFELILPEYRVSLVNKGLPPSAYFPLSTTDVVLSDRHGVPYDQQQARDVIRAHFFKADRNGNLTHTLKSASGATTPAVVLLVLSSVWWAGWQTWHAGLQQELEAAEEEQDYLDDVDVGNKRKSRKGKQRASNKRAATPSTTICAELTVANVPSFSQSTPSSTSSRPPSTPASTSLSVLQSPARTRETAASMAGADMAAALRRQTECQFKDFKQLLDVKTLRVGFHKLEYTKLERVVARSLVESRPGPGADMVLSELTIDFGRSHSGTFKRCWFGQLTSSDPKVERFFDSSEGIVAKQALIRGADGGLEVAPAKQQGPLLYTELNVMRWANALMLTVYTFVENVLEEKQAEDPGWKPRATIPKCSFVECGLAVEQGTRETSGVYLVEERIGGRFKKFMNNDSAVPFSSDTFSQFLAFSQHVQYIKSEGMAYVNDYQGGPAVNDNDPYILLTDPQILTNPDLGRDLFAGGNVSPAFRRFPTEHICTVFCEDFGLPRLT
ncbi:Kinase-like protein [Mycena kentingensis (nom. inval.)]|nr:Kinase-like protein [Mycena kentingensis (nom. inval.)]